MTFRYAKKKRCNTDSALDHLEAAAATISTLCNFSLRPEFNSPQINGLEPETSGVAKLSAGSTPPRLRHRECITHTPGTHTPQNLDLQKLG